MQPGETWPGERWWSGCAAPGLESAGDGDLAGARVVDLASWEGPPPSVSPAPPRPRLCPRVLLGETWLGSGSRKVHLPARRRNKTGSQREVHGACEISGECSQGAVLAQPIIRGVFVTPAQQPCCALGLQAALFAHLARLGARLREAKKVLSAWLPGNAARVRFPGARLHAAHTG
jgi:hypothetical protein